PSPAPGAARPPGAPPTPPAKPPEAKSYPNDPIAQRMAREASPAVISERVVTDIPYPTEAEADARALEDAQKLIQKRLRELGPPVEYLPPLAVVKHEYVKRDSRLVRLPSESEKNAIVL